jgi:translation initiation factor 2 subunit 1
MEKSQWPNEGDLVVVKIKRILDVGAVVDLIEYPGKEGFVHISQVASSWVKNIRQFLSEGQARVGVVKRIDSHKNSVDISLRDVSKSSEKLKIDEWQTEKRAGNLMEKVTKEIKETKKTADPVIEKIIAKYGGIFPALEAASADGESALKELDIPDKWKKGIVKVAQESIKPPEVEIKGDLILTSYTGNGVETVKEALKKAVEKGVKLYYISAPRYRIEVKSDNYITAEKTLDSAVTAAVDYMKEAGGLGSFERIKT